jgi:hypothetical protein
MGNKGLHEFCCLFGSLDSTASIGLRTPSSTTSSRSHRTVITRTNKKATIQKYNINREEFLEHPCPRKESKPDKAILMGLGEI